MNMRLLATLFVPLAIVASFSVHAATPSEYDAMYSACIQKAGPINNGVVESCSGQVSEKAQAEIARHYESIYARIKAAEPADATKFATSQKMWVGYRDLQCDLAGTYIGSPMFGYCPMKLNAARALELRELDGN
jgi:uncharacterized protein YecT (DUF1311 family)